MMNDIFNRLEKRKIMIIGVIIVTIVCIISFFADDEVVKNDGTYKSGDRTNTPYVVDAEIKKALVDAETGELKIAESADGGYKIDINIEELSRNIIATLNQNDGDLGTYLNGKNKEEILEKMVKAELITQYPDLRSLDKIGTEISDEDEFQGAIRFTRHKIDNTRTLLEYIPLGEESDTGEETLYGLINSGNSDALNYFSLNGEQNLVVAIYHEIESYSTNGNYNTQYKSKDETINYLTTDKGYIDSSNVTTEFRYEAKEMNYQSVIEGYGTPFEYLWAFLVCGKDEKFIEDFAELILESELEVGIYDSLNIDESATISVYNSNTWRREREELRITDVSGDEKIINGRWLEPNIRSTHHYDITYRKDKYNSIAMIAVNIADVWFMTQTVSYTYEEMEQTNSGLNEWETIREIDKDEEFADPDIENLARIESSWTIARYTDIRNEDWLIPMLVGDPTEFTYEKRRCTQIQSKSNQYAIYSANNMMKSRYTINGAPEVNEQKLDRTAESEDGEKANFCTIYLTSESARNNITEYGGVGVERLLEILASNEATVDMVDFTKYILYKATDMDFGVTRLDLTIFHPKMFKETNGSTSQMMNEYIFFWESGSEVPKNETGTKYIVYDNGNGRPTVGHGYIEDLNNSEYTPIFILAGYSLEIGSEIDIAFVDAIEKEIIGEKVNSIESRLQGLNLTGYQKTAIISRCYDCGTAAALDTIRNGKNFVQSYQAYWTEQDNSTQGSVTDIDFNHQLYTSYMSSPITTRGRRESEWALFQTGYYGYQTNIDEWYSRGDIILQSAYAVADHFRYSGVDVHYAGNDVASATNNGRVCIYQDIEKAYTLPIENPKQYGVVCATFVGLSVWQAGLCSTEEMNEYNNNYNYTIALSNMLLNKGWKKITSYDELQPGDIWFESGHVAIYVGDGMYIDQAYCVKNSDGSDSRGELRRAYPNKFWYAIRATK